VGVNAVFFQVRSEGDAFYESDLEPWSHWLTGEQGTAPDPFYDPLAFAVEAAHERGLELHAWFNPFRAGGSNSDHELDSSHVEVDAVDGVALDHVHFDDYFYPYPSYADGAPFPDSASWARARRNGWSGNRDDWRRHNVNQLIERLYRSIKAADPQVKFGVSPFGIWRPDHPPGVVGFDAYAELYANARKWLREGWVDYMTPQLYYRTDQDGYPYPVMLRWWIEQNRRGRHVWPGLYTSRVGTAGDRHWSDRHLLGQIYTARSHPGASGQVHFSMQALMPLPESVLAYASTDSAAVAPATDTLTADSVIVSERPADSATVDSSSVDSVSIPQQRPGPRHLRATAHLLERLPTEPHDTPALVPASPWLDAEPPARPILTLRERADRLRFTMEPAGPQTVRWWAVRYRRRAEWTIDIVPGPTRTYQLDLRASGPAPEVIAVSAVDRAGNESPAMVLRRWAAQPGRPAATRP
jgi:uncharacterized lipoprotein YddW (UPF0748 family)